MSALRKSLILKFITQYIIQSITPCQIPDIHRQRANANPTISSRTSIKLHASKCAKMSFGRKAQKKNSANRGHQNPKNMIYRERSLEKYSLANLNSRNRKFLSKYLNPSYAILPSSYLNKSTQARRYHSRNISNTLVPNRPLRLPQGDDCAKI